MECAARSAPQPAFMPILFPSRLLPGLFLASSILAQTASKPDLLADALSRHNYPEAIRLAASETKAHPGNVRAWVLQALALEGAQRHAEALRSVDYALQLRPGFLPAAEAGAQIAYSAHDPSATNRIDQVLTLDPHSPTAHAMGTVLAIEAHNCPTAIAHLEGAPILLKLDRRTRTALALCYAEAGEVLQATGILEPLHAETPSDPAITFDLAALYVDKERFADASALLLAQQAYAALDPDALNLLGASYAGSGRVAEAIAIYRKTISIQPHEDRNYIDLALLAMDHQSPAVALGVLDSGITANPKSARLYTMRGSVYAQVARNDAAQADFEQAERLAPNETFGALGLGVLLRDESNLPEAQHLLEGKLNQSPADPVLNYMLADVLIREGANPGDPSFARAQQLLARSLQADPNLAQAHASLGKLALKANDLPSAMTHLERAVALAPKDRTALNQLIAAYRRSGRAEDATRVSAQLATTVAAERDEEVEKNRTHLILDAPSSKPDVTR